MNFEIVSQYGLIILAVVVVLGLKAMSLNRRVKKQFDGYIDPVLCI
jgi:hypothetical protein